MRLFLRRMLWFTVGVILFAAIAWLLCPKPDLLSMIPLSRAVLDREGNLLRLTLAEDQAYRLHVSLSAISDEAVRMTLFYEDQQFYHHPGINPVRMVQALGNEMGGENRRYGASTLSMQVARVRFSLTTHTWWGKAVQAARALQLERHYKKEELLEAYFTLVPYGGNVHGIEAASRIYFKKAARDLTRSEAMTLAAIPQSPRQRAPRAGRSPDALVAARKKLWRAWIRKVPEDAVLEARLDMPVKLGTLRELPFAAPHLTQIVLREASRRESVITSTVDTELQERLERCIRAFVRERASLGVSNAGALLVDSATREIRAAVGSADFFNKQIEGQNSALTMRRSPGSTLKPLLYAQAIDEGLIHSQTLLRDAPVSFAGYNPENFDQKFMGPVSAAEALRQSRNVPAVFLADLLKKKRLYELLQLAEVRGLKPEATYGLTLALGGAELSMIELAQIYSSLAQGGVFLPLRWVQNSDVESKPCRLVSAEAAFMVLEMLAHDESEGGVEGGKVAWKTGTSWAFKDAWTAGVFDGYVVVTWVGNFNATSNAQFVGARSALPLLRTIVASVRQRKVSAQKSVPVWQQSEGLKVKKVRVCAVSGALVSTDCPRSMEAWFIPGVSPIDRCAVHQRIWIDKKTGQRVLEGSTGASIHSEVFELWPTDLLALFERAGLPRREPPPLAEGAKSLLNQPNLAPRILSPNSKTTYTTRVTATEPQTLLFQAAVEPGVRSLFWFVDDVFLGRVGPGEPLAWTLRPGAKRVLCLDDRGQSAAVIITVEAVE